MKGIKLPVLFLNGNDLQLTELGVKSEDECVPEVRNVLFYRIDAASPHFLDEKECTCIHTASQDFICPMPLKEVERILETHDTYADN
jgi:hypothetical protein